MTPFTLRPARPDDAGFLTEMIVAAVNWNPERPPRARWEILDDSDVTRYVAGWSRPGDLGVVAEDAHGQPVGACWLRFFATDDRGYGFVAPDVPEISLAVAAAWRGRGVGRALLRALAERARQAGIERLSLSVESVNHARDLYRSEGFVEVGSDGDGVTMVRRLEPPR